MSRSGRYVRDDNRTGYYVRDDNGGPDRFVSVCMTEYPVNQRHGLPVREPVLYGDPTVADHWRAMDQEMRAWEDSVRRRWHV